MESDSCRYARLRANAILGYSDGMNPLDNFFRKKPLRYLLGAVAVFAFYASGVAAWQISTEKDSQDTIDTHPNRLQVTTTESSINNNRVSGASVLPKIIGSEDVPRGLAVDIGNGQYLTTEGVYKKLDNGSYLTPDGLLIHTENGPFIHLQKESVLKVIKD
jgi:hypothetical protein